MVKKLPKHYSLVFIPIRVYTPSRLLFSRISIVVLKFKLKKLYLTYKERWLTWIHHMLRN